MGKFAYLIVIAAVMLNGCAGLVDSGQVGSFPAFSFGSDYDSALKDYEQGRIMSARKRVLTMDKKQEDYAKAQKLLRQKIEPARLRLLRHFSAKGKQSESAGKWSEAMKLYAYAANLSTKPAALQRKSRNMEMKMRQARMTKLIQQRRSEDSVLLAWLDAYEPPKGVPPKDSAFERARENLQDMIDDRGSTAYRDAKRYENKKMPELAYIEVESYLRLVPDSERGSRLMADIKAMMPKGIVIPKVKSSSKAGLSKRVALPSSVKREQVQALIQKGDWIRAKKYALVYRRDGGKGADRLLAQIQANIDKQAASVFAQGRLAFRKEQLDEAVRYWQKAVALVPDNSEYVDALRRAQQLQERLRVLRSETKEQ